MQRSSWIVSALGLAASLLACTPDISQVAPTPYVTMQFDPAATPAVVPQPNNLAINPETGLVVVPPNPGDTPTQTAFNNSYLATLDGFPMETPATTTTSGDLNPTSLATGVLVLDITNQAAPVPVKVTPSYAPNGTDAGSGGTLTIPGPLPGALWQRGHTYAAVVIGGTQPGAVTGSNGQQVTGSSTWALISSAGNCTTVAACAPPVPLCILPDGGPGGTGSGCLPVTDLIPSQADAIQLQQLQTGYAPLLAALTGAPFNIPRSNVAILWTFSIVTAAEVTFDPANTIIPFPNDVVRTGPNGTVSLPVPPGTPAVLAELIGGLNTLDGFSETATISSAVDFSLPNDGVSALLQGSVDPSSLNPPLAIGFVKAFGASQTASQGPVNFSICLSDVSPGCPNVTATLADGGVKPQMLGIVPTTPLDELTTYAAYMTNSIRDTTGKAVIPTAAFALVRLPYLVAPLYKNGKSQVTQLTDDQAALLVQLQQGLDPLFQNLGQQGIPNTSIVQLWAFKTQSTISQLQQLASLPYTPGAFTGNPLWVEDVTAVVLPQLTGAGVPTANIKTIYSGEILDPFALTGPTGTFNPDGGVDPVPMQFIMTVPMSAAPAGGYPVTMFGHGLGGNKTNAYAIASALATAGQVMIAIDEVWHGERNTCTGFGAYADGVLPAAGAPYPDTTICTTAPGSTTCNSVGHCQLNNRGAGSVSPCSYGMPTADQICFNLGQGSCAPDSHCDGSDFNEAFSGWNLLNLSNLFATRDNFREQVIDNSQFARVAQGTGAGSLAALTVPMNPGAISYSGQSLGGILGTLYASVAFNVQNTGLNVPGGDPVEILLIAPAFASTLAGFQAGLAEAGIVTDTPTYDLFIDIAQWILDPADPTNMGYFTIHKTGLPSVIGGDSIPATRRTFVQWIVGDEVVPNPTALQLIQAVLHNPSTTGVLVEPDTGPFWAYQFNGTQTIPAGYAFDTTAIPACPAGDSSNRHPFLLEPPAASCAASHPPGSAAGLTLTTHAQTQLVGFLSGAAPY
jgi:hypothetical protein